MRKRSEEESTGRMVVGEEFRSEISIGENYSVPSARLIREGVQGGVRPAIFVRVGDGGTDEKTGGADLRFSLSDKNGQNQE